MVDETQYYDVIRGPGLYRCADGIVLDPGLPDVDTEVWYPLSNGYTWVNFVTRSAGD